MWGTNKFMSLKLDFSYLTYSGYVESYYYVRAVVSNTEHATLHSGSSSYNYCTSSHVYWYNDYGRCHVHDWLNSHGTICAEVNTHGNGEQVSLTKRCLIFDTYNDRFLKS